MLKYQFEFVSFKLLIVYYSYVVSFKLTLRQIINARGVVTHHVTLQLWSCLLSNRFYNKSILWHIINYRSRYTSNIDCLIIVLHIHLKNVTHKNWVKLIIQHIYFLIKIIRHNSWDYALYILEICDSSNFLGKPFGTYV
jgi:hypothetical protein